MIYLVCFALSAFFAYLAEKQNKRWLVLLFSGLSILLPILLAGLRDLTIGIDTFSYYTKKQYWGLASAADSLWSYLSYYLPQGYGEVLFALFIGIFGQIGSYPLFLLFAHSWIMVWVYVGAWRLRKHVRPWLVLLLFYLAFYNHSLNALRQYMALAVAFAFLPDLLNKKYLRYTIAVAVAFLIHTSGVLSMGLLAVHWCLFGDLRKFRGLNPSFRQRQTFVFICVAILVLIFNPAVRLLVWIGILHKKYLFYVNSTIANYNLLVVLFLAVELIAATLLRKQQKEQDKNEVTKYFFSMSVVYFILYQVTGFLSFGKRIAACCCFANLVTLAMLPSDLGEEIAVTLPKWLGGKTFRLFPFLRKLSANQRRLLGNALLIACVLFYWCYVYWLRNASQTMPYRFIFQ